MRAVRDDRRARPWRNTLLLALPAFAQAGESAGRDVVDTVIVTGSRIRSDAGESTGPVTVMSNEQLNRGGNDSLGKVLQTLPYNTGAPTNTNVNNGGDGSTRVALRGLGPQRTLVLLNGRRLPNGGIGADSSVDVDSLPLSMVERVEVLTTGASAVYGADAVGGVLNVITRSGFEASNWACRAHKPIAVTARSRGHKHCSAPTSAAAPGCWVPTMSSRKAYRWAHASTRPCRWPSSPPMVPAYPLALSRYRMDASESAPGMPWDCRPASIRGWPVQPDRNRATGGPGCR